MKIRLARHHRFTILATMAAVCALAPALRADWGSLRSNNRTERGHEVEHGRPVVVPGHPAAPRVVAPRHVDIEAERRHGFYWAGYHPGLTIGVLPVGYVQVSLGGTGYYYYDGVYFRPTPEGPYAVVAPPVGVIVPQLPEGADRILVGQTTYYYAGGAFYLQQPTGFAVVAAPLGVTVQGLPPGALSVFIRGKTYFVAGSTYFIPVMAGGVTVFVTAQP